MSDGDVLTLDSAQPGGSGSIAGETKFKWAPAGGGGGATPFEPWAAFKPKGIYIPAGVVRDGGPGDDAQWAESQLSATTTQFDPFIFAYPEVAPYDATIDALATYLSGGGGPKFWIGIARNTLDSNGNPYPGAFAQIFSYTHVTGFDGQKLREGVVSVAVTAGELFWLCFQGDGTQPCMGSRQSTCFRNAFGNNTPATFSTTNQRGQIGRVTKIAATYNAALTDFPAEADIEPLTIGSKTYIGSPTILRPSLYFRYQVL